MTMLGERQALRYEHARWRTRGYLPHFESAGIAQAVTFRLADSLPGLVLTQIEREVEELGTKAGPERRKRIEDWLDRASGACWLRDARIAKVVEDGLTFMDGRKYHLHAWAVMPNHVHALFTPIAPITRCPVKPSPSGVGI